MLTIRREQLEVLVRPREDELVLRLVAQARASYPEEVWSLRDAELEFRLRKEIQRANGYGLFLESHVWRWVELSFELGSELESTPEYALLAPVLENPTISSGAKANAIETELVVG